MCSRFPVPRGERNVKLERQGPSPHQRRLSQCRGFPSQPTMTGDGRKMFVSVLACGMLKGDEALIGSRELRGLLGRICRNGCYRLGW